MGKGRSRFIVGEETSAPWVGLKGNLIHEYTHRGWHRLTYNGKSGDWVDYANVATIKLDDRFFGATTDYWNSELPEIFEIQTIVPRSLLNMYSEDQGG